MEIKKYNELREVLVKWADWNINLLIIESKGGLGKTFLAEKLLKESKEIKESEEEIYLIIKSHATPLSIYKDIYKKSPSFIIFDDVDSLLFNKTNISLLKMICESTMYKKIKYMSTTPILSDTPQEYTTTAHTLLLTNHLQRSNKNLQALFTRGIIIQFKPSNFEILNYLKEFAKDKGILAYLEGNINIINNFNLRIYIELKEIKDSGLNWKDYALKLLEIEPKLEAVGKFSREDYVKNGFGSQRDYYNWRAKYNRLNEKCTIAKDS